MSERKTIPPKSESHRIGKHTVTITFVPSNPPETRWSWSLRYVSEQVYVGYSKDIPAGMKAARKKIEERDGRNDSRRSS